MKERAEKARNPRRSTLALALAMFIVMVGIILLSYFVQVRNQNIIIANSAEAGMYGTAGAAGSDSGDS